MQGGLQWIKLEGEGESPLHKRRGTRAVATVVSGHRELHSRLNPLANTSQKAASFQTAHSSTGVLKGVIY